MRITYSTFKYFCPSSAQPSEKLVERIEAYIVKSNQKLREAIGAELHESLDALTFDPSNIPDDMQAMLLAAVTAFVCLDAYYEAIPSLDLVLTATGFGVVSNQNTAPASADRVRNLRERIAADRDDAFDYMLGLLRGYAPWCEGEQAQALFSSLFWRGADMVEFPDMKQPHRSDLLAARSKIEAGEIELARIISPELLEAMCADIRTNTGSMRRSVFVAQCRRFVARAADSLDTTQQRLNLIAYLDRYLECFPEYEASSAYKANHFTPYENKLHDSCYFFGK